MSRTAYRTCPLCEATCGLEITLDGDRVTGVRGDADDVFSHGFVCPKGATLGGLDADPDRLAGPLARRGDRLVPVSFDEAFAEVEAGLTRVREARGPDAVAVYVGNPTAHTLAGQLYGGALIKSLGTRNVYSASTADQMPKHVACGLMFGDPLAVPVPDLDRTSYLLMLGANPVESNGSLCTAPDFPGRLKALRARGGRLVVVDPRFTRTARLADRHVPIRPGTDAYLLFGILHTILTGGSARPGRLAGRVAGLAELTRLAADFAPERVAGVCGVPAGSIRELAADLAAAPSAAVYARIGTCTAEFGTLASWLVDVLNVVTGNLDRPGGAMFATPAHRPGYTARTRRPFRTGRWHSRVRGLPETLGELPVATLAEEIETAGEGQVRALVTVAGNPVLSAPGGPRLDRALAGLDFMVSVDPYVNETTRHAHVVLPPPRILQSGHYDFALYGFAVRNVAHYSPPVLPLPPGRPDEGEILARLALIAAGQGAGADPAAVDELMIGRILAGAVAAPDSPVAGRDPDELRKLLDDATPGGRSGLRRLDLMLRLGPYGEGFGADPDGLTLGRLLDHPHGVDLGPLRPALDGVLRTASGRIELCPDRLAADVPRLRAGMAARRDGFVLIGRRHLRSNNSWGHNVPTLTGGSNTCTLQVNPADVARLGLAAGKPARVTGRAGEVVVPVEPTDTIMPGVVSLPHGWGHDAAGARLSVAVTRPGANANALTDEQVIDPLSGNAVFNGVPVRIRPADEPAGTVPGDVPVRTRPAGDPAGTMGEWSG